MFANDDDMVECPYNNSHRMLRKRLQPHLLKCRIHYPDVELRKCPFNMTHLIPEPEFTHHVTNCSDRKLITQYKYDAPEPKEEELPQHAPIESEENWDETDVADYDPVKYVEKASVIRRPDGPTPSDRKEFIKKERIRLGDADSDEDIVDNGEIAQIQDERRRSRSPINRVQRNSRDRSPLQSHRNPSPPRRRSSNDRRTYNSNMDNYYSRSSQSYRDRSPTRRSTTNDQRSYNKSHGERDHYRNRSPHSGTRTYNSERDPYYNSSSSSPNGFRPNHSSRHDWRDSGSRSSRDSAATYEKPATNRENPGPRSYYTANYNPTN